MFQADKLVANQTKAIESAQAIAQLALKNAQAIAEIQYGVAKEAVTTAKAKSSDLLKIKDPKEVFEMIKPEDAQAVVAEATAVQAKVSKVVRKAQKEVVEMIESALDESKADLAKLVKEATAKAPAGSESFVGAFNTAFDAAMKGFDQAYSTSKDAYATFEKTVEGAMSSFQGQFGVVTKPAAKARKAIAA